MKDGFKLKGSMQAILTKADGSTETTYRDNIIVNAGFDLIAAAIANGAARPAVVGYIAVGTGSVAPTAGDTILGAEIGRVAATYAYTAGSKQFTLTANFDVGVATGAITECGAFNDPAAGTMFDRLTFSVINKAAGDTLRVVLTFTMS